jgi:RimJ/RimL family protein N-acetyltransferase
MMTSIIEVTTHRLLLRQWRDEDLPLFARINADPQVMKYFPSVLSIEQSNAMAHNLRAVISQKGWGFWAVELAASGEFIGFVGLNEPAYELPFAPCVEVGWRLAKAYWGRGYATEAGRAALAVAFDALALPEVVSFTPVPNKKSRAVMERLGMTDARQNFMHPAVPEKHPLREHVLYRITHAEWQVNSNKSQP